MKTMHSSVTKIFDAATPIPMATAIATQLIAASISQRRGRFPDNFWISARAADESFSGPPSTAGANARGLAAELTVIEALVASERSEGAVDIPDSPFRHV